MCEDGYANVGKAVYVHSLAGMGKATHSEQTSRSI